MQEGGGIYRTVQGHAGRSCQELYHQTARRLESMIAHGSTTVEAKSGYGLDKTTEVRMLETVEKLGEDYPSGPGARPSWGRTRSLRSSKDRPDEYIGFSRSTRSCPEVSEGSSPSSAMCSAKGGVHGRAVEEGAARGEGPRDEAQDARGRVPRDGGAELAAEVGAVSADHLAKPSDDGIMAMATKDVVGACCRGCTAMHGEYADARRRLSTSACRSPSGRT